MGVGEDDMDLREWSCVPQKGTGGAALSTRSVPASEDCAEFDWQVNSDGDAVG